ncbi:MAG: response regulator [Thermoplasmata archaeon]
MRVLIVDDEAESREALADALGKGGHTLAVVSSSTEAIAALEEGEFDVMFSDLKSRRASGMELLTIARERWPRLLVVMLATKGTVETAVQAVQLGAFDYLQKPVRPEQVQRVLELVAQQLALIRVGARPLDPARYARTLAAEGGYYVLLISPLPPLP